MGIRTSKFFQVAGRPYFILFLYRALLYGTIGAALLTLIFYLIQFAKAGELVLPMPSVFKEIVSFRKAKEEDGPPKARVLMTVYETIESFLVGMGRIFPALIVLTLAWAVGAVSTLSYAFL